PAASRSLAGPHARVAERLLELSFAGRDLAIAGSPEVVADPRLRDVADAARVARDEVVGLVAVYPPSGRRTTEDEHALLAALAAQLAVAVQNARLHERTAELSLQREAALASERAAARRLGALYEISRSFAQELSLEKTLDALAQTIVEVLDIDAAVIGMPDE